MFTLLTFLLVMAACTEKVPDRKGMDNQRIEKTIAKQNEKFMETLRNGNMEAFGTLFVKESGKMMPPNRPAVTGRDSIVAYMKHQRNEGFYDIKLQTKELYPYSDYAIEIGEYEVFMEGQDQVDQGKYMVYWKKSDGQWRIYRDIWNSNR